MQKQKNKRVSLCASASQKKTLYISYDFQKDGHFVELKEAEILRERINTLEQMDQFVGKYYSEQWIRKNVLRQSEAEIRDINKEIEGEGGSEGGDDDMGF